MMITLTRRYLIVFGLLCFVLVACVAVPETAVTYSPTSLQFDGQQALLLESEFVQAFPSRHSGTDNNLKAVTWLRND